MFADEHGAGAAEGFGAQGADFAGGGTPAAVEEVVVVCGVGGEGYVDAGVAGGGGEGECGEEEECERCIDDRHIE